MGQQADHPAVPPGLEKVAEAEAEPTCSHLFLILSGMRSLAKMPRIQQGPWPAAVHGTPRHTQPAAPPHPQRSAGGHSAQTHRTSLFFIMPESRSTGYLFQGTLTSYCLLTDYCAEMLFSAEKR